MKRLAPGLLLFLLALPAAGKPKSGLPSTVFDGKVSGARFIGLGEQGAAAAGGPESPLWNPAALHDLPRAIFSADFDVARQSRIKTDILEGDIPLRGRKLTYLGFAGTDAAFFYRPLANFSTRVITSTATPDYDFVEEDLKITQFGFGAANEGEKGATLGLNISYLNAHRALARAATGRAPEVEFADGNGFTLDAGLRKKWDQGALGASFLNVPGILYWNNYGPDQLPIIMRTGASFYPVPAFGFHAEFEERFYRGGMPRRKVLHLGMELTPLPWIQIRGGTYGEDLSDAEKTSYAAGFSAASAKSYQVDFALRTYRFQSERVYNYFLSILLPLPDSSTTVRDDPRSPARFQGKSIGDY